MSLLKKLYLISILFSFFSCDSESKEDDPVPEERLFITTVEITLIPENGGDTITAYCYDPDSFESLGYSGQCSTSGVGKFNKTYVGSVRFLNEGVDPVQDLTEEIIDNGTKYQVLFGKFTGGEPYTYEYLPPFDSNGNPIGINFKIHSSDQNCALVNLLLDSGGSLKNISHVAEGLGGEVYEGEIIASGNTHIECNY